MLSNFPKKENSIFYIITFHTPLSIHFSHLITRFSTVTCFQASSINVNYFLINIRITVCISAFRTSDSHCLCSQVFLNYHRQFFKPSNKKEKFHKSFKSIFFSPLHIDSYHIFFFRRLFLASNFIKNFLIKS